jgi:hypothetical protein
MLSGAPTQCWAFANVADGRAGRPPVLAAACSDGFFEIVGDRAVPIKSPSDLSFRPNTLNVSRVDQTRVWMGLFDGLASFRRVDGRWIDEGRVDGVTEQIRSVFESADGSLWAGALEDANGLLRVRLSSRPEPGNPRPATHIDRYGPEQGLPAGGVTVTDVAGTPVFLAGVEDPHVVQFDPQSNRFARDRAFDGIVGSNPILGGTAVGRPDGRLYLNLGRETAVVQKQRDGTWKADRSTFARLGTTPLAGIYPDADGVTWLQFADGRFVRFDTTRQSQTSGTLPVLIRKVTGGQDRALYGGGGVVPAGVKLRAPVRVLGSQLRGRERHRIPVQAGRSRHGVVRVDARGAARLHEPRLRRLPLPGARARRRRRGHR